MKCWVGLLAVTLGGLTAQAAFAAPVPAAQERAKLAAGLSCVADDIAAHGSESKRPILISNLNTPSQDPQWNQDGNFEGMTLDGGIADLDFNNGCDNDYDFVFLAGDLQALAKGEIKEVKGLLHFFNSYQDEGQAAKTAVVTCTLFKGKIPE